MDMNTAVQDTKEFLGQARRLSRTMEEKRLRANALRDMALKTTSHMSDMPRAASPYLQQMETFLCKAADLEKEIVVDGMALDKVKQEITEAICDLPNYREQRILYHRYVECKAWSDVSEACGCHVRTAHRQHDSGVSHLAAIMAEKLSPACHLTTTGHQ